MTSRAADEAPAESQWERTRLSWRRTALALTVVALLTVRMALRHGTGPAALLGLAAALGGWVAVISVAQHRIRTVGRQELPATGRQLPTLALLLIGYATVGVLLVLTEDH